MSNFSSNTLAALVGAAVGAGLTYVLLKDKDELDAICDTGGLTVDKACDDLEESAQKFFDLVEEAIPALKDINPEAADDGLKQPS
ncbi:MAG: hypothetical protein GX029_11350 [Pseudomonadaceae bacterium]|nr:hypothetical protein [Pseudomonadaceae bacterium]